MGLWHCLGHHTRGLVSRIHLSLRVHHLFLKRGQVSLKPASFTLATTCLPHISSSSYQISVKFDITGKLFPRGIQRRMLRRAGITSYGKRQQLPKLCHPDHLGAIWCISNLDLSNLDISPYAWDVLLSFPIIGSSF